MKITSDLKYLIIAVIAVFLVVNLSGCGENPTEMQNQPTPYELPDIPGFPKNLNIPAENPMTVEGVELGRYLFYDGRLAGSSHPDSMMTCATCHVQKNAFEAGIDNPRFPGGKTRGLPSAEYPEGKETPHYMLPLFNLVYNHNGYLWNGWVSEENQKLGSEAYGVPAEEPFNFRNLESLVWMTIEAPHEVNGDIEKSVRMIESIDKYPPMFEKAFGTPEVNIDRMSKAIAQFLRSIVSYNSKFHRYLRQEATLSEAELRGHNLFFSEEADCFHCHGGSILMTTNEYFNNAKDSVFNEERDRFVVTGDPLDIGAYKAPSLLNIELTAPYMHDGRFKNLDEVIDFYSEGLVYSDYVHPLMKNVREGGVQLSDQDKEDLKAFLLALTDHQMVNDPAYSKPSDLP